VTVFWIGVIASVITGALVNELGEISPSLARKVVVRAARLWAEGNAEMAAIYEEEWTRIVDDAPGKLTKLGHSLRFYFGAVSKSLWRRARVVSRIGNLFAMLASAVWTFFVGTVGTSMIAVAIWSIFWTEWPEGGVHAYKALDMSAGLICLLGGSALVMRVVLPDASVRRHRLYMVGIGALPMLFMSAVTGHVVFFGTIDGKMISVVVATLVGLAFTTADIVLRDELRLNMRPVRRMSRL
jgi:hypothetical protein